MSTVKRCQDTGPPLYRFLYRRKCRRKLDSKGLGYSEEARHLYVRRAIFHAGYIRPHYSYPVSEIFLSQFKFSPSITQNFPIIPRHSGLMELLTFFCARFSIFHVKQFARRAKFCQFRFIKFHHTISFNIFKAALMYFLLSLVAFFRNPFRTIILVAKIRFLLSIANRIVRYSLVATEILISYKSVFSKCFTNLEFTTYSVLTISMTKSILALTFSGKLL